MVLMQEGVEATEADDMLQAVQSESGVNQATAVIKIEQCLLAKSAVRAAVTLSMNTEMHYYCLQNQQQDQQ